VQKEDIRDLYQPSASRQAAAFFKNMMGSAWTEDGGNGMTLETRSTIHVRSNVCAKIRLNAQQ
jgi:hypothetical protein